MEEKELTPMEALEILTARTNNAVAINFARMMGKGEWLRASRVIKQALEENDELKKWKSKQIDLIKYFNEQTKTFDLSAIEKEALAMRQKNMVSIEDVKKIVENEKCKVCDSKWHKGCRCARNKIITELDKLKGGE